MNARDEAALSLWQAHHETTPMSADARDRMAARLREFFGPTSHEYEEIQSCVAEAMAS